MHIRIIKPLDDDALYPELPAGLMRFNRKNLSTTWVYLEDDPNGRLDVFRTLLLGLTTEIRGMVELLAGGFLGEEPGDVPSPFGVNWINIGDGAGRLIGHDENGNERKFGQLVGYAINSKIDYISEEEWRRCGAALMEMAEKFGEFVSELLGRYGITEDNIALEISAALFMQNQVGIGRSPGKKA